MYLWNSGKRFKLITRCHSISISSFSLLFWHLRSGLKSIPHYFLIAFFFGVLMFMAFRFPTRNRFQRRRSGSSLLLHSSSDNQQNVFDLSRFFFSALIIERTPFGFCYCCCSFIANDTLIKRFVRHCDKSGSGFVA